MECSQLTKTTLLLKKLKNLTKGTTSFFSCKAEKLTSCYLLKVKPTKKINSKVFLFNSLSLLQITVRGRDTKQDIFLCSGCK